MYIKVVFSAGSLWGDAVPEREGIDAYASMNRFAEAVERCIQSFYPKAEITVFRGDHEAVKVNGSSLCKEARRVDYIIDQVWSDEDWIVYKQG